MQNVYKNKNECWITGCSQGYPQYPQKKNEKQYVNQNTK